MRRQKERSELASNNGNFDIWQIAEGDFPAQSPVAEQLGFLLRYAILAPSPRNTQPWKFSVKKNSVWVFLDDEKVLSVADRDGREMYISVGCAIANLLIAAEHFGLDYEMSYFPQGHDSNLVALLQFGPGRDEPRFPDLFAWITTRRSNRSSFLARDVEEEKIETLLNCFDEQLYSLALITDAPARGEIAKMVARADRTLYRDRIWRREVAACLRPEGAPDGITARSMGLTGLKALFAPFVLRHFDLGSSQAARDQNLVEQAPLLAILSTTQEDPMSWVGAGVLTEEFLLTATALGLQMAFFDQVPELPQLRTELAAYLKMQAYPQLMLRLGYGPVINPSPRRPVADVLVD
jgi:hypothetical protein